MSRASTAAKQRWNKLHYSEIKASLGKDLVERFKTQCREDEVSIASVLAALMTDYCGRSPQEKEHKEHREQAKHREQTKHKEINQYSTRPKRRRAISIITGHLEEILQNETMYRDNMPENLRNSIRAESSDYSIEKLGEALEALREAY